MNERLYLGAYWGARRESAEDCSQRLAEFLAQMGPSGSLLGSWWTKPRGGKLAQEVSGTNVGALKDLLLAGGSQRDVDGSPIEELGYRIGLWNGDKDAAASLSLRCGGFTSVGGLMNSLVLEFPTSMEAEDLYDLEVGRSAMRAAISAWEPDWATLTTDAWVDALSPPPRSPAIGWITYLAASRRVPADAPVVLREQLQHGTLLVSAGGVEGVTLPTISSLSEALLSAGALGPTPEQLAFGSTRLFRNAGFRESMSPMYRPADIL